MKNIFKIFICFILIFLMVGCTGNEVEEYYGLTNKFVTKVKIIVVDDQQNQLFYKNVETVFENLTDVMTTSGIDIRYSNSEDERITSMFDLEYNNSYQWVYYIDDEGPYISIFNQKVEDGKTYKFVYETIQ